jgi:putative DNA primase/helicase
MTEYDPYKNLPVLPLGHTGTTTFFYFVRSTRQVVALSPGRHSKQNFLAFAEEVDWELYPFPRVRDELDWVSVGEILMAHCRDEGIYDPSLVRGRGAWRDGSATVFHAGDALYVNSRLFKFADFTKTNYRYVAAIKTVHPAQKGSTVKEGEELLSVLQTWGWERPSVAPVLLLGWLGCSFVCGALQWRPHLWVTGTKGSGKSTLDGLLSGILGNLALHVQGNTTEPGLRQALNGDALPVLFDEFEAENANARAVIDLARSAASDNAAAVIKGTPEGKPIYYRVRFAGMFSGIIANVQKEADRSRIVFLEMHSLKRDKEQRRELIENLNYYDADFGAGLLRRMLDALANGVFDTALSKLMTAVRLAGGDERKADVFAHLLAAYHVLISDMEITELEAASLVNLISDLDEGEPSDEQACLSHLLGHRVTPEYGYTRTLGEWLIAIHKDNPAGPTIDAVDSELERHGVKINGNTVKVANATPGIRAIYKGSRWANGAHKGTLRRLANAKAGGNVRFAGNQSKCTAIEWSTVMPVE